MVEIIFRGNFVIIYIKFYVRVTYVSHAFMTYNMYLFYRQHNNDCQNIDNTESIFVYFRAKDHYMFRPSWSYHQAKELVLI
jgi:hypothetical protein